MEHNIGVGVIVGLATASSFYIYKSEKFSSIQKTILLICVIFPPAQWLGILIVLAYNNYIENNSVEKIAERRNENKINTLNSQVESLKDLKEKGILTEEEYKTKVKKIEAEKTEQNLKNSIEYKQLKGLFESGVLTKEEFESKIKRLNTNKTTSKNISIILNDKRVLIVSNNFKNNLIGSKVKFENNDTILNGNFLSERKLIVISNGFIKNILNGQIIYLNNNQKVIIYKQFDSVISLNDFVYYNNEKIKDGIYQISFLKNFTVSNGKIINISFLLNIL